MSAQTATPNAGATKWVYLFSELDAAEQTCGSWDGVRGLLGGKGANLADMVRIGVPVPPGFIVSTARRFFPSAPFRNYPLDSCVAVDRAY